MLRLPAHAARALSPAPLAFVACATAGFALALQAGLIGLPLFLILSSWSAKYAFILLESTAHGLPPPVLSIEMVNPFDERRPLGALLVVATVVGLLGAVRSTVGEAPAVALAAVAIALAPASLAVLAIEGDPFRALHPGACATVARRLGGAYPALAVAAGSAVLGATALARANVPTAATLGASLLLLFAWSTALGGALHDRRDELGLDAVVAPERTAVRDRAVEQREFDREVDEIYGLVRARRIDAAWGATERWLARNRDPQSWWALLERAEQWEDARIAARLRRELLARLHPDDPTARSLRDRGER